MKKLLPLLLSLGVCACSLLERPVFAVPDNSVTVYITETGHRFHRDICGYLTDQKKYKLSRGDALAEGLTPCRVCRP